MNQPAMQDPRLNVPAYVTNARLIAWVAEMAALTEAERGLLVRRQRRGVRRACARSSSTRARSGA